MAYEEDCGGSQATGITAVYVREYPPTWTHVTHTRFDIHTHTHGCIHTHSQGEVDLPIPRLHVDLPIILLDSNTTIVPVVE